jgi:hypothetical protein
MCAEFRWINCAYKVAVFWVKPWKFCGATLQYVTVKVPAECWASQWVGEISWFIHVALKGGWMFVVSFYRFCSCIVCDTRKTTFYVLNIGFRLLSACTSVEISWQLEAFQSVGRSCLWVVAHLCVCTHSYVITGLTCVISTRYVNRCASVVHVLTLVPSGDNMYHLLKHSVTLHFAHACRPIYGSRMIIRINSDYFFKHH